MDIQIDNVTFIDTTTMRCNVVYGGITIYGFRLIDDPLKGIHIVCPRHITKSGKVIPIIIFSNTKQSLQVKYAIENKMIEFYNNTKRYRLLCK
jgi:hypothetical protein